MAAKPLLKQLLKIGWGLVAVLLIALTPAWAGDSYKRADIIRARFGDAERQALLVKAYSFADEYGKSIIGQAHVAVALQERLVRYLENLGTRQAEPDALHLIGLPGVGKSASLEALAKLGIPVVRIDAQKYANPNDPSQTSSNLFYAIRGSVNDLVTAGKPVILLIDEVDKAPEIIDGPPKSQPVIGALNEILSEGRLVNPHAGNDVLNLSNVLVLTGQNFSPQVIERFAREAIGEDKSFWDFTEEDFENLDRWIRLSERSDAAVAKVLATLFRSNTIGRLLPDVVITKPLYGPDYDALVRLTIENTLARTTAGTREPRKISVEYTDAFAKFLRAVSVYPPSGARKTIKRGDQLVEQLVDIASRATTGPGDLSLDRPRKVQIDANPAAKEVTLTVTPVIRRGSESVAWPSFQVTVSYDPVLGSFGVPDGLALAGPKPPKGAPKGVSPLTQREIIDSRFGGRSGEAKGLSRKLDAEIFGQHGTTAILEEDFARYLGTVEASPFLRERVLAGFPGIGKSDVIIKAAEKMGLEVVKINLQEYSADSQDAADKFVKHLHMLLEEARGRSKKGGKFVLLFEELDKVTELDPKSGAIINRPVMAHMKELLNDGRKRFVMPGGFGDDQIVDIDIRDALTYLTMNFSVERFAFSADPRLTTIEDVMAAYRELVTTQNVLRKLLSSMFLPETVNRLLSPRFHILKPLDASDYEKVVLRSVGEVARWRLTTQDGKRNSAGIDVRLTSAYREEYLYRESVIPSEGARQAYKASTEIFRNDLESAVQALKGFPELALKPVTLWLDYKPRSSQTRARMVVWAAPAGAEDGARVKILEREVSLRFPGLETYGPVELKRMMVAVHEFGHAMTMVQFGRRFEVIVVVSPDPTIGGYVKHSSGDDDIPSGRQLVGNLLASLGSRAMERVFFSDDPASGKSVLDINQGASSDIATATEILWRYIYTLGLLPGSGVIERSGLQRGDFSARRAFFAELPHEVVEQLSLILQDMEDWLVRDLLGTHDLNWYKDRILQVARQGEMSESEFYELIGYPFPGKNGIPTGQKSRLEEVYGKDLAAWPAEVKAAISYRQGNTDLTAADHLDAAMAAFEKIARARLDASCERLLKVRADSQ